MPPSGLPGSPSCPPLPAASLRPGPSASGEVITDFHSLRGTAFGGSFEAHRARCGEAGGEENWRIGKEVSRQEYERFKTPELGNCGSVVSCGYRGDLVAFPDRPKQIKRADHRSDPCGRSHRCIRLVCRGADQ